MPTSSEELGLVWEAWGVLRSSYVDGDNLDSTLATSNMILRMLSAGERSPYPFLTELDKLEVRPPADVPSELVGVWKAWRIILDRWPNTDARQLAHAAIDGMLETLGDDSVVRLTPELYDRVQEELEDGYEGIGAFVNTIEGKMVLIPMRDRPADKAGVMQGDVVLEVDGQPVTGKSREEVVDLVRGPAGTRVTLLLDRLEVEEPIEIDVIRSDINTVTVERTFLPGAIGYIYISEFLESTHEDFLDVLEQFTQLDTLALILDLRGNPGGSTEAARRVASQFLSEGIFGYEVDKRGQRRDLPIEEGGIATEELPIVVIVNRDTASAAESMAGALQDAQRAKILGTRTMGTGSTRVYEVLSDSSAIHLPVARWYTPSGKAIHGSGIRPDIEVPLTDEDRLAGVDSQLTKAYDHLDGLLPRFR